MSDPLEHLNLTPAFGTRTEPTLEYLRALEDAGALLTDLEVRRVRNGDVWWVSVHTQRPDLQKFTIQCDSSTMLQHLREAVPFIGYGPIGLTSLIYASVIERSRATGQAPEDIPVHVSKKCYDRLAGNVEKLLRGKVQIFVTPDLEGIRYNVGSDWETPIENVREKQKTIAGTIVLSETDHPGTIRLYPNSWRMADAIRILDELGYKKGFLQSGTKFVSGCFLSHLDACEALLPFCFLVSADEGGKQHIWNGKGSLQRVSSDPASFRRYRTNRLRGKYPTNIRSACATASAGRTLRLLTVELAR